MANAAMIEKVKAIVAAESACPELKAAANAWLDAAGTDAQEKAANDLIAELKEDILTTDQVIALFESPAAKERWGEAQCEAALKDFRAQKEAGITTCQCPGCAAGQAVLDSQSELFA